MTTDSFLLVQRYAGRWFGRLPQTGREEDAFVETLVMLTIPPEGSPDLQGCPRENIAREFETQMRDALNIFRSSSGTVN